MGGCESDASWQRSPSATWNASDRTGSFSDSRIDAAGVEEPNAFTPKSSAVDRDLRAQHIAVRDSKGSGGPS